MKFLRVALVLAFLLAWALPCQTAAAQEKVAQGAVPADEEMEIKQAVPAAEKWLSLVDEGKYDLSWEEAASIFRMQIEKSDWNVVLKSIQESLGKIKSRTVESTSYMTELPGAPDGRYVVIRYQSTFQHKKHAVETVTMMLDKDGAWRSSGYYID